jgi:PIN domain nuclease of toxin-antitoxin system
MRPVLDASAVLAVLRQEPGFEAAMNAVAGGIISAVNVAEIMAALLRDGVTDEDAVAALALLGDRVIAADLSLAVEAGRLRRLTDVAGLSLGDRFCLALARRLGTSVVTGDRAWLRVADRLGVTVHLIR